jgi:hypothetical protein
MIKLSTTLATAALMIQHHQYVLSIGTNPQPPSLIPIPAFSQFVPTESYLSIGCIIISS